VAKSVAALLDLLDLEQLEVDLYRGRTADTERQRVFGGQVAAQALKAAYLTVERQRAVHSLHAYFLRPGDSTRPIVFSVDRARDGRSFSTRRVVAVQRGRPIFNLTASFHLEREGLEHQDPVPSAPDPETLVPDVEREPEDGPEWGYFRPWYDEFRALDVRHVADSPMRALSAPGEAVHAQVWLRTAEPLADDPVEQACVLTYASDLTLIWSTVASHAAFGDLLRGRIASLDHAIWFHRPFRVDDWLLYDQASPSASGARGFATGRLFDRTGRLVASVAQEGLIELP